MSKHLEPALVPLEDLILLPGNAKRHDLEGIGESIERWGIINRPTVNRRTLHVLGGNGRVEKLLAVKAQGLKPPEGVETQGSSWLVPVDLVDVSESEEVLVALALNELTIKGGYNEEMLAKILAERRDDQDSLKGTGFDPKRVQEILAKAGMLGRVQPGADQDHVPEEAPQRCELGDLWEISGHRVLCGNCRDPASWDHLLQGEKANGVFTSPPYAEQRKEQYGGVPTEKYVEWWEAVQACVRDNLASDGSFFLNIKAHCEAGERVLYVMDLVLAMRRRWGWRYVDEFCWKRRSYPGYAPNRFKNAWEPVHHFTGNANALKFRPKNVLQAFSSDPDKMYSYASSEHTKSRSGSSFETKGHKSYDEDGAWPDNFIEAMTGTESGNLKFPAIFPVGLPEFFINAFSDPGDVWVDPFCGSGTTLVACHKNGRLGRGIEILPKYCDVILKRLEDLTGEQAVLLERLEASEERVTG